MNRGAVLQSGLIHGIRAPELTVKVAHWWSEVGFYNGIAEFDRTFGHQTMKFSTVISRSENGSSDLSIINDT